MGEHSGAEQAGAILDTAGLLPRPGAKPLGEALQHGLDAFTAGCHANNVVHQGVPHDLIDGPPRSMRFFWATSMMVSRVAP
ncbi:hypothetical protein [Mycolicibacterium tusciae]|uniref:hypothetical protein n=1 Tax=Mycolicibacterium tusciae TaxID=75922 RepID=UPI00031A4035|nr:hypothetical protein [Mycolicibacterium tusciae]